MASTVNTLPASVNPDLLSVMNPSKSKVDDGSVEASTDKFMTLLVTQLKNQDPLNPMDNAQLTSQLAQLQTVTGINKLNTTLDSLKSSYQSSESLQATNMINRGVLVEGNYANLTSGKAIFGASLASAADKVLLVVTDPRTGKDVDTIDLGSQQPGVIPVAWDGIPDPSKVDADGKPIQLKDGKYLIRVVATRGDETLKDAKSLSFDVVSSVTTSATDGVKLNLPTKGVVTMADIKQVM